MEKENNDMTGHSEVVDHRVDFGGRLFVTWVFIPVILSLVMNAVAFGQTGNLIVVLWGLITLTVLLYLANLLHSGNRRAERITMIVAGVFFLLAIGEAVTSWGTLVALHITFQCLMPPLLALMLLAPPIRLFLAWRRGESLPEEVVREDGTAAQSVPRMLYIVAVLLIGSAAATAFLGADQMVTAGTRAIAMLVGLLAIPVAAVLLMMARDFVAFAKSDFQDDVYRDMVVSDARSLFSWLSAITVVFALVALFDLM